MTTHVRNPRNRRAVARDRRAEWAGDAVTASGLNPGATIPWPQVPDNALVLVGRWVVHKAEGRGAWIRQDGGEWADRGPGGWPWGHWTEPATIIALDVHSPVSGRRLQEIAQQSGLVTL